jgi:hypothetical protein
LLTLGADDSPHNRFRGHGSSVERTSQPRNVTEVMNKCKGQRSEVRLQR